MWSWITAAISSSSPPTVANYLIITYIRQPAFVFVTSYFYPGYVIPLHGVRDRLRVFIGWLFILGEVQSRKLYYVVQYVPQPRFASVIGLSPVDESMSTSIRWAYEKQNNQNFQWNAEFDRVHNAQIASQNSSRWRHFNWPNRTYQDTEYARRSSLDPPHVKLSAWRTTLILFSDYFIWLSI